MKVRSPIFEALAAIYEESQAGRTGLGARDVQPAFEELCKRAGAMSGAPIEGDAYELAVSELASLDGSVLKLQWDHPRARTTILKVRLSPLREAEFYTCLEGESPAARRMRWRELFERAAHWPVDARFAAEWQGFCENRADRARHWEGMEPFRIRKIAHGQLLLDLVARLLAWNGNALIRWVSSHLCGHSKHLERQQGSLEILLCEATAGRVGDFAAHGIEPMPREARFHGPLRIKLDGQWKDYGGFEGAQTIALADLRRSEALECTADRCLTVENKTPFEQLVRLRSGVLLVWTSFPNEATRELLVRVAGSHPGLEFYHFGDTDPQGFHIVRDLRQRTGIPVQALHMRYRPARSGQPLTDPEKDLLRHLLGIEAMESEWPELAAMLAAGDKGDFEQESLQPPTRATWPFW